MIAYFLLVHRYPAQFKRLFKAIYLPGNQYVIHVDKSSGEGLEQEISAFLEPYQGVELLESRDALWGGYSLVEAELRGMTRLLEMDSRWSHYINFPDRIFRLRAKIISDSFSPTILANSLSARSIRRKSGPTP